MPAFLPSSLLHLAQQETRRVLVMPPKTHAKSGKATKAIAEGDKKKRKGKKKPESYGFFIYKVLFIMILMR